MNEQKDKIKKLTKECIDFDKNMNYYENKRLLPKLPFGNTITSIFSFCRTTHINHKESLLRDKCLIRVLLCVSIFMFTIFQIPKKNGIENWEYFDFFMINSCLVSLVFLHMIAVFTIVSEIYNSKKVSLSINNLLITNFSINSENNSFFLYKLLNINYILSLNSSPRKNKKYQELIKNINVQIERLTKCNKSDGKSINLLSNINSYLYVNVADIKDIVSDETIDLYFFINTVDLHLKAVQENLKYIQLTPDNLEQLIYNLDNDFYPNTEKIRLFFSLLNHAIVSEDCRVLLEKIIGVEQTVSFYQRNKIGQEDKDLFYTQKHNYLQLQK